MWDYKRINKQKEELCRERGITLKIAGMSSEIWETKVLSSDTPFESLLQCNLHHGEPMSGSEAQRSVARGGYRSFLHGASNEPPADWFQGIWREQRQCCLCASSRRIAPLHDHRDI
jgi:hypothetical protein